MSRDGQTCTVTVTYVFNYDISDYDMQDETDEAIKDFFEEDAMENIGMTSSDASSIEVEIA